MTHNEDYKKHYVAIIGGSISGSEAANILANNGFRVVVFEMNKLPYGKIEDGLPSWHINLRDRQINEINNKLNHPNINFVPQTKIGKDIDFEDLVKNWGFSAIILANGAWFDRRLPIPGIEKFVDKELIYQNSFIYWFNHKHQQDFDGKNYFIKDNAVIIGGGLASLDVVKIVMMELVKKRLYMQEGISVDLFTLEKYGIPKILEEHNLTFEDLNLGKAKLVYRRTAKDMPLKSPKDDSEESILTAREVSEKLLNKYVEKYLFEFVPKSVPVGFKEENNKLTSLVLQQVAIENGKVIPIENSFVEVKTEMLISSIGSVPEQIKGLEYEWSALKMCENSGYHVFGFENVFAIGNAVTGRGNIQESKKHGKQMTELIMDKHLTEDAFEHWLEDLNNEITEKVDAQIGGIVEQINKQKIQPEAIINNIILKTNMLQKEQGFSNYLDWVNRHLPIRLEEELKK